MPFLAFDLAALEKAPNVARAARITEDAAIAGMARMWKHCWHEKTDEVDLVAVEGFFGGEAERVVHALETFRFVESKPEAGRFRVRGADRYLRIAKGHSEGGKKSASNLRRGGPKPALEPEGSPGLVPAPAGEEPELLPGPTPNTEHRTPIEKQQQQIDVGAPEVAQPEDLQPDPDGNFAPTAWGFWGWHNAERQQRGLFAEERPPDVFHRWYADALKRVGVEGLARAYPRYLGDHDFARSGWPWHVFASENVWLSRANPEPKARRPYG